MHMAAASPGLGDQQTVPAGQLLVPGLGRRGGQPGRSEQRDPRGHQTAAQTRRRVSDEQPEPVSSRPRPSRLVRTLVAISTWNLISSCCTPGSPSSISTRSEAANTVAPVDGSRSTNSSSTPSVIPPAARIASDAPPGTVMPRGAPPRLGITTTIRAALRSSAATSDDQSRGRSRG